MIIRWELKVKFRAFGITFGTLEKNGILPIAVPPIPVGVDKILVNERGVYLYISVA
jgi:hypothetical protein